MCVWGVGGGGWVVWVYVITIKRTKNPIQNDLKLGLIVVVDTVSKLLILGSEGQESGTGSSFQTFGTPFISVEWMQLRNSNVAHRCTMGGYCQQIRNSAGMYRVL